MTKVLQGSPERASSASRVPVLASFERPVVHAISDRIGVLGSGHWRPARSGRLLKLAGSGKRDPSIDGCPAAHTFDQQGIAGDSCIAEKTLSRIFPVPVPTRSTARRNW
jgi:hypothetical protein